MVTRKPTKPCPAELRDRAVRLVREREAEHGSQWAAICSVSEKRTYIRDQRPHGLSVRRGCELMGVARSSYHCEPESKRKVNRAIAATEAYSESRRLRKKVEVLFAQGMILSGERGHPAKSRFAQQSRGGGDDRLTGGSRRDTLSGEAGAVRLGPLRLVVPRDVV